MSRFRYLTVVLPVFLVSWFASAPLPGFNPSLFASISIVSVSKILEGTVAVIDTDTDTITETVIATIYGLFGDGFESGDTAAWSEVKP